MNRLCELATSDTLTLYYYGELNDVEYERFRAHTAACRACSAALAELDDLGEALEDRRTATRTADEWESFMRRLDRRLAVTRGRSRAPVLALAAMLLAAVGLGLLWQRRTLDVGTEPAAAVSAPALAAAADRHFDRARLVVLGLAMKEGAATGPEEWARERQLAASLLPDTRLFRMAAIDGGNARLADLLGDLETVLIETSMATDEQPSLGRIQRLIERRGLIERIELRDSTPSEAARAPMTGATGL
jgi:hypothetical protein